MSLKLPDAFPRDLKVVATDFDRTLVWEDNVLHPRTIAALRAVREAGVEVIVVTGRMVQSVRRALEPTGLHDPVICYQGAVVVDGDGEWLRHEPIPLPLAREAIDALAQEGFSPNVYVDDELFVAAATDEARRYAEVNRIDFHVVGDLLQWLSKPPTKLVAVGDPAALDAIQPRMRERFGERLYISKSLPIFLEFAQAGVTKAAGLDALAAHMGFSPADAVAFGDGENDVELVSWAGFGVAVENAHERVKAVADWVCPSAEVEGVAEVLGAYLEHLG